MPNTEIKIVHSKTFETIQSAVNKMVDFIRPTYGPAGNKIIIAKDLYFMVVDDGVQGARDFDLPDKAENAIVKLVREVAVRTNDRVGDGTTSSLIMVQAMVNEIARRSKKDGRKIGIELKKGAEEASAALKAGMREIRTLEELVKVALVSFDNEEIARMIAGLYHKLGKDGIITIDRSPTMKTYAETAEGIQIENGYLSQYMINNPERMEAVIEKPYILITDYRLTEANDIIPIMNKMAKAEKRELVIICENMESHALATAVVNKLQGKFFVVAVAAPKGDDAKVFLEDIALVTGAKVFSQSKGDKLENAELSDLGRAEKFICRREDSVIVNPKGKKAEILNAVSNLRAAMEAEKDERAKVLVARRMARFTNQIAVIKVGAPTENEQKALKYKVEDTIHAVKAAYKSGVVCGAGLSLARLKTSSPILNEALKYPSRQLWENMGMDEPAGLKDGEAENVVTGRRGKFMEVGVMDPVDVLIAGIESAVSIVSILVTSSGMIVEWPKDEKAPQ